MGLKVRRSSSLRRDIRPKRPKNRRAKAARTIQQYWRRHVQVKRAVATLAHLRQHRAAASIQAVWRAYVHRYNARVEREFLAYVRTRRLALFARVVEALKRESTRRQHAALVIQRGARVFLMTLRVAADLDAVRLR